VRGRQLNSTDSELGPVAGYRERRNKHSGSIKVRESVRSRLRCLAHAEHRDCPVPHSSPAKCQKYRSTVFPPEGGVGLVP
jgi:hypothetical protein